MQTEFTTDNTDKLIDEFAAWCKAKQYPHLSADELYAELNAQNATKEDQDYVLTFIARWEEAEY